MKQVNDNCIKHVNVNCERMPRLLLKEHRLKNTTSVNSLQHYCNSNCDTAPQSLRTVVIVISSKLSEAENPDKAKTTIFNLKFTGSQKKCRFAKLIGCLHVLSGENNKMIFFFHSAAYVKPCELQSTSYMSMNFAGVNGMTMDAE